MTHVVYIYAVACALVSSFADSNKATGVTEITLGYGTAFGEPSERITVINVQRIARFGSGLQVWTLYTYMGGSFFFFSPFLQYPGLTDLEGSQDDCTSPTAKKCSWRPLEVVVLFGVGVARYLLRFPRTRSELAQGRALWDGRI